MGLKWASLKATLSFDLLKRLTDNDLERTKGDFCGV